MRDSTKHCSSSGHGKSNAAGFIQASCWKIPCVLATLVYLRSVKYAFIFDDRAQILQNPQVQSWTYLPRLLTTHVWSQKAAETLAPLYRPVFSVWLLIVYSVAGSTEWLWHGASLLLYVLTIYLVYRLAQQLLEHNLTASAIALLFAVHPIHIEAVCWISACNELLVGALATSSIFLFLQQLQLRTPSFWGYKLLLSLVAWTAALFAKESALPLVLIFPYAALRFTSRNAPLEQRAKAVARRSAPYIGSVLFYLAARMLALGKTAPHAALHTWRQVAYTAPSLFVFYMNKLLLPTHLSGFYLTPVLSSASAHTWVIISLTGAILCMMVWLSRKNTAVGVGCILLLGPLVPVIGAFRVFQDGDAAHDRYLFLPSLGLCLLFGMALKPLLKRTGVIRASALVAVLTIACGFAWLVLTQETFYRDEEAYFRRAVDTAPSNVLIIDYLGDAYMREQRMQEAITLFERAHSIAPNNPNTTYCLARGLFNDKRYRDAEPYLEEVVKHSDLPPLRRFQGGMLLAQDELALQKPDRARSLYVLLSSEDPLAANIHFMLGSMDEVEGRFGEAREEYLVEYKISGNPLAYERAVRLSR